MIGEAEYFQKYVQTLPIGEQNSRIKFAAYNCLQDLIINSQASIEALILDTEEKLEASEQVILT